LIALCSAAAILCIVDHDTHDQKISSENEKPPPHEDGLTEFDELQFAEERMITANEPLVPIEALVLTSEQPKWLHQLDLKSQLDVIDRSILLDFWQREKDLRRALPTAPDFDFFDDPFMSFNQLIEHLRSLRYSDKQINDFLHRVQLDHKH
jgi:hypothetical protein